MRVLVVEDSDRLRKHLCRALKKSGYAVDDAADGEDGLVLAQEVPYDAIILDIMLPKLGGLDVLQRLRQGGRETPILLLTARDKDPIVVSPVAAVEEEVVDDQNQGDKGQGKVHQGQVRNS